MEELTDTVHASDPFDSEDAITTEDPIAHLRTAVATGVPWYRAVLETIALWRAPQEIVGDRYYRYLIGGEAFDWLLLAERLATEIVDFIPADEYEALLFTGKLPEPYDELEFKRLIGPNKYRAHLNFLYGVTAEEALQLAVEEEIDKEVRSNGLGGSHSRDDLMYDRIYGRSRFVLLSEFRLAHGLPDGDAISFADLREFVYWLFKLRMVWCPPARVASDTRKALSTLSKIEIVRLRQREAGAHPFPYEEGMAAWRLYQTD